MSFRRTLSSQQNGRLSHGPKTPEGLKRCQTAPLRHGLLAESLVAMDNEDPQALLTLIRQFTDELSTTTNFEAAIVEELVSACWRRRRSWRLETHLLNQGLKLQTSDDPLDATAGAYVGLANTPHFKLLLRYEAHLHSSFHRALRSLINLKKNLPLEQSLISNQVPESTGNSNTVKVQAAA